MESTWDKPQELVDWDAKIAALQNPIPAIAEPEPARMNGAVPMETSKPAVQTNSKSDSEDDDEEDQVGWCGRLSSTSKFTINQYILLILKLK